MNTFNRVVIVIALLVLIPLLSLLFLVPHNVLTTVGEWMVNLGEQFWRMQPVVRLPVGILLALIFDAIAVVLLYLELRRKRRRFIKVQDLAGGMATISVDSVVQQLQYRLDPKRDVIKVKPEVQAKGNKVKAVIDVTVAPGGNVPQMAADLVETVREVLTTELGLQIADDPQVRLKVAPPPQGGVQPAPRPRQQRPPQPIKPIAAPAPVPTVLPEQSFDWGVTEDEPEPDTAPDREDPFA